MGTIGRREFQKTKMEDMEKLKNYKNQTKRLKTMYLIPRPHKTNTKIKNPKIQTETRITNRDNGPTV